MPKMGTIWPLLIAVVATAGCQTYPERSFIDPFNLQIEMPPRTEKRVQVAPSEIAFAIRFRDGRADLSDAERRAAKSFLMRRAGASSDEVTLDIGVQDGDTELAHQRRLTVAEVTAEAGLDPARIGVRRDMPDIPRNEMNLTVRRYLATLPGCPDFTSRAGRTFDNRPHANWGCANATNLGLMVAEPGDLLRGRGTTPADGEAMVLSVQRYRQGMTRPLALDDSGTAESYGVSGSSGGGEGAQ